MKWFTLLTVVILLSGCATYKENMSEGLNLAKQGAWQEAENTLEDVLDSPQDQLLYYLEIGSLAQHQGDFERSNTLLEKADDLSDTFLSTSFTNRSWALLSNARQSTYKGSGLERVYISYLKSLNYLALAEQATSQQKKQTLQDSALVEARRIDIKLNEIRAQNPSYQDIKNKKDQAFYLKALNWLGGFYTGGRETDNFLYRDDAWGRYIEGLQYEISKEYDDARVSYQKSAELYESGYAAQYDLSDLTAERAWLDTIRMMSKNGFNSHEIEKITKEKLSISMQETLKQYRDGNAELVVLEHQGFIPAKSEMSLLLHADPRSYSLVLQPFHLGGRSDENDSFRWFAMAYADTNLLNLIANYKVGGPWGSFSGIFTKRVILGKAIWRQLSAIKLDDLLTQKPVRVTVPFYQRYTLDNQQPKLNIHAFHNGNNISSNTSLRMTSLADIAFQEQLAHAQRDIYEGLIREMLRSWLVYQVSSNVQDEGTSLLLGLIGQVAVFASSSADTRNWLTLPAQVRLTREPLLPGKYSPSYTLKKNQFSLGEVELQENEIKVWNLRNPN